MSEKKSVPQIANSTVIQGEFKINNLTKSADETESWITDWATPEMGAVVRKWANNPAHTKNYNTDMDAYNAAKQEAAREVDRQNAEVGALISTSNPPAAVAWGDYAVWAAWYFSGLEYQNNSTGGWHSNRAGLLPGGATTDGDPTRYVEFRRPGAVGEKDKDKMERCIFDLLSGRCWPNAHYDRGYVEVTGIPGNIRQSLLDSALEISGLMERKKSMTLAEKAVAGAGFVLIGWLINKVKEEKAKKATAAKAAENM
ncbi:hypothetical protein [Cellvibrio mixtus]|uniref:hypothetical protein n=1 Tax=Cellvibrio mixtus TaxID=39650 RepID=UPI001269E850|nr:hypothetical protein [Cellvibrio mixtus]